MIWLGKIICVCGNPRMVLAHEFPPRPDKDDVMRAFLVVLVTEYARGHKPSPKPQRLPYSEFDEQQLNERLKQIPPCPDCGKVQFFLVANESEFKTIAEFEKNLQLFERERQAAPNN